MAIAYFITHPEVVIDPSVPVTAWPLSSEGVRRTRVMLGQPWVERVRAIFCSAERKAREAARIMADHLSSLAGCHRWARRERTVMRPAIFGRQSLRPLQTNSLDARGKACADGSEPLMLKPGSWEL